MGLIAVAVFVLAGVIFYVGRRIARVLWHMLLVVENHVDRLAIRDGVPDIEQLPPTNWKKTGRHTKSTR